MNETRSLESFRGQSLTPSELDDFILIALAIRQFSDLDETMQPRERPRSFFEPTGNIREIARAEGWRVDDEAVDAATVRLSNQRWIVSRAPDQIDETGYSARLTPEGVGRAAAASRRRLGKPLQGFIRDDKMFDGMEQIQVDFLGERLVIGCVEGEEDKAVERAHRFEVDCGEVMKATSSDLDPLRAAIMGGILAHERIEELETGTSWIPATDRLVPIDHNAPDYAAAVGALEHLIRVVRESNSYREADPDDHDRRLSELEAGQKLLSSRWVSSTAVKATLWGTIVYLIEKFADAPIGEAANLAWTALKHLLAPYF